MAKGVNKAIIVGNLGNDPEIRYMPNGEAVTNFSVATSETWKDKQGQQQERTEWHNIVMYRRLAEIAGEYLKKGSKVYLEGKLKTSKWQDQQTGQDRYKTEINVHEMQMLDSANSSNQPHHGQPQQQAQNAPRANIHPQRSVAQPQQQMQTNGQQQAYRGNQGVSPQQPQRQMQDPNMDGWDDDIPFN